MLITELKNIRYTTFLLSQVMIFQWKGGVFLKWRFKKFVYSYNRALEDNFANNTIRITGGLLSSIGMFSLSFLGYNLFLLSSKKQPLNPEFLGLGLLCFFAPIIIVFIIIPMLLDTLVKRDSYKKIPILKDLRILNDFDYTSRTGKSILNDEDLEKIEGSLLEESNYPTTEALIKNYEMEIIHICKIVKNKRLFDSAMIDHATLRANNILVKIAKCIKSDEENTTKSIQKEKELIASEWAETYKK